MSKRAIPAPDDGISTKTKIMNTASTMFALRGFKAVTLKDIAAAVGIRIASFYYHYNSKDALIKDVLSRFESVYMRYHLRLAALNENASSLEEVLDNIFYIASLIYQNPTCCLGISIVQKEQHSHEAANEYALTMLYKGGIENIQAAFDGLIERNAIPTCDTRALATLYIFHLLSVNELYVHQFIGTKAPVDCDKMQRSMRTLLTDALMSGTL